jgi:hypothetical protein
MNTKLIALFAMALGLAGCSKAVVTIPERTTAQQPMPAAPVATIQAPAQSQTDRLVEIDRMLSAPLTGLPEDADRRSALRAERAALMALGNYSLQADQSGRPAADNRSEQPSGEMVSGDAHGNVVSYGVPPPSNDQIVVADDSQGRSGYLPFLEGMTPSERLDRSADKLAAAIRAGAVEHRRRPFAAERTFEGEDPRPSRHSR